MENEDLKNIRLSYKASEIADEIKKKYYFKDAISVCKLALSYALSNYLESINFEQLDSQYTSDGTNYNVGSLEDQNMSIKRTITSLYPECKVPYRYARVLIIFGLYEIDLQLKDSTNSLFNLINRKD